MCTMDSSLLKLYVDGVITYNDMMTASYDQEMLKKLLSSYALEKKK